MIARGRQASLASWLLLTVAVADAVAAALTFFLPDILTGPAVMNGSARGTALIMLVLAIPLLLLSIWLERRGSRWAPPLRLGALAYLAYNCFMLLFATPFNSLFLLYIVAMWSTAWAFGVCLLQADTSAAAERLPLPSARVVGGYIWLIVVLNVLAWMRTIVPATFASVPGSFLDGTGLATNPTFVQDLVFWLPGATLIGWLAWTRRPWGALLAGAYLVYGLLESIGVATDQWFGSSADPTSEVATMGGAAMFAVLAVIGVGALTFYMRALQGGDRRGMRAHSAPLPG